LEIRKAFEKVKRFVDWEYKEKRPKSVQALRVKSQTIFTIGALPDYQIKSIGPVIFIVVSNYGDSLTVYLFNKFGDKLGSKKYEPTPKFMKELKKSTTLKYHLPKEEKISYEDSTLIIQKAVSKIHRQINHKLGITHRYLYTIFVDRSLKFTPNRMCGSKRGIKEIHIPFDIKEKQYLEVIAIIEWFYSYISSIIPTTEEKKDSSTIYELALLLSAVFNPMNVEKMSKLILLPHIIKIRNYHYNLTELMTPTLTSFVEPNINQKNELIFLLKRYLVILQLLKRYKIELSIIEIVQLFQHSCEIFRTDNDTYLLYISEEEDITGYFYFKLFSRSYEIAKELKMEQLEYKTFFLSAIFGLSILDSDEIETTHKSLAEVIENTCSMMNNPLVYTQIGEINNLVSDLISKYIVSQLSINMQYAIEGNVMDMVLEIQNPTNYPLQDFTYKLAWKPENRIKLTTSTDITKSRDLHEKLKRNYLFEIVGKGTITITCIISFMNPIFNEEKIEKSILLNKVVVD